MNRNAEGQCVPVRSKHNSAGAEHQTVWLSSPANHEFGVVGWTSNRNKDDRNGKLICPDDALQHTLRSTVATSNKPTNAKHNQTLCASPSAMRLQQSRSQRRNQPLASMMDCIACILFPEEEGGYRGPPAFSLKLGARGWAVRGISHPIPRPRPIKCGEEATSFLFLVSSHKDEGEKHAVLRDDAFTGGPCRTATASVPTSCSASRMYLLSRHASGDCRHPLLDPVRRPATRARVHLVIPSMGASPSSRCLATGQWAALRSAPADLAEYPICGEGPRMERVLHCWASPGWEESESSPVDYGKVEGVWC